MGRGTWKVTVHGVTRVGHDLAAKLLLLLLEQYFGIAFLRDWNEN